MSRQKNAQSRARTDEIAKRTELGQSPDPRPKKATDFYRSGRIVKVAMFVAPAAALGLLARTTWLLRSIISGARFDDKAGTWTLPVPESTGRALLWCWVIWVTVPPAWFAFEFFYLYDRTKGRPNFDEFKYGQEIVAKAWATVVIVVGGVLYKSLN